MGNVNMEAEQVRFKNATYRDVQSALTAALNGGSGGGAAEDITYDNTSSGLTADDVQAAIDELAGDLEALEETVGDESSGLVKEVSDLSTTVSTLNPNVYSTTEINVGKWGNEDLYRLKIDIESLPNNTLSYFGDAITDIDVKRVYGVAKSVNYSLPLPYSDVVASNAVQVYFDYGQHKVAVKTAIDYRAFTGEVVIEYTKNPVTENNNR